MLRRGFCLILSIFLVAVCIPFGALQADATPYDHPNTHVNTGDQRADVVAVALTQIGYYEGPGNDTKYGVWYGLNGYGWCGMFVAWCANQAGVPTSIVPKTGTSAIAGWGMPIQPSGYIPKPGDIFFCKDNSHVGLVYYVDGNYFYSIEGNTYYNGPEGVYSRRRVISSYYYLSPKYQGGKEHTYYTGYETAHPHKEYKKCNSCNDMYYTGNTTTMASSCQTCKQSACVHAYSGWIKYNNSNHYRVCSSCGKQETVAHNWNAGRVTKEANCGTAGSKTVQCTDCGTSKTVVIPQSGNHSFNSWLKKDEKTHTRTCTVCKKTETVAHTVPAYWNTDADSHWFDCSVCQEKIGHGAHAFGELCDSPCGICGYVSGYGHHYREEMAYDEAGHWYACDSCDVKGEYEEHVYTSDCDTECDVCGYGRRTDTDHEMELKHDAVTHWKECTVCATKEEPERHILGKPAYEGAAQYCTVCELLLIEEQPHVHGYHNVQYNHDNHWGTCSCGITMETEPHAWSVQTGKCVTCGATFEAPSGSHTDLIPWVVGGGAIMLVGMPLTTSMWRKKKK